MIKRGPDEPHDGRDLEAGARDVGVQAPGDLDPLRLQADFLLGFAKRRGDGIAVRRLHPAAGKADLTGMSGKVGGALSEDDGHAAFPLDQRHEHGGMAQFSRRTHTLI